MLDSLGLGKGMSLADLGCGRGYFLVPAAEIVGETGTVYGVDVDSDAILHVRSRVEHKGLNNVVLRIGRAEETVFCHGCVDVIFLGTVLHDFDDPVQVLLNARRMIRTRGKLINLDWKKLKTGFGPPYGIRLDEKRASTLIEQAGFAITDIAEAGRYHYIITAEPLGTQTPG